MKRIIVTITCTLLMNTYTHLNANDSFNRFADNFTHHPLVYLPKSQSLNTTINNNTNEYGEKPIVVVICTYNNAQWSEKNISSVFSQNYSNMRMIIIDDCSTDNNAEVIQAYIDTHNLSDRVTFIRNTKRMRKLFNIYKALYTCQDNEIIVMLDGDDWLAHDNVLQFLNQQYENQDTWFTYGQYRNIPAEEAAKWGFKEIGYCREIPEKIKNERAYRKYSFVFMHPRSFWAWLFKQVKLEDLIAENIPGFEGDFYPAANDVAMYYPMIEMAHTHVTFIPDITYIRNLYNEIVGFKVDKTLQISSAREIRKKPSYPILNRPKSRDADLQKYLSAYADCFIIVRDNLNDITKKIDSIIHTIKNIHTLYIFYVGTEENKNKARRIIKQYKNVIFLPYQLAGDLTLKNRLLESIIHTDQDHIIITDDTCEIVAPINISSAIYWLEKTYAHRFYLQRAVTQENAPQCIELEDDICAWKFLVGNDIWRGITSLSDMTLYKKTTLLFELNMMIFKSVTDLDQEMQAAQAPLSKIGLCFKNEKVKRYI